MRAASYDGPRQINIRELPVPQPDQGQVLVEVEYCGICGTDLHLALDGWTAPGTIGGHEWSGRVVQSKDSAWQAGDLVVGNPSYSCGTCEQCVAGRPSLCRTQSVIELGGAFADYVTTRGDQLVRVPDNLDARTAALAEPLAVALHAITQASILGSPRVLVTGAGPIGLFVIAALHARGIDDITVSEPHDLRRDHATKFGVKSIAPADLPEAPAMPFDIAADPYDVVFECSGNIDAVTAGLGLLKPSGTFVFVGAFGRKPKLDANRILMNELVVTGAYNYDANGIASALELLASGRLPTQLLVEPEHTSLDGLLDAMERLAAGQTAAKVLVRPREHG